MTDQLPVDPSVITPVVSSGGASASPLAQPMTLDLPPTSATTEVPNYLNQVPTSPTANSLSPVSEAPVPSNSASPAPPGIGLPAVQTMFEQLKASGALLSDINIKPKTTTSPLAHLQPDQLISSSQGPQPAFVVPTQPSPVATIQLASTAPPVQNPTSQHMAQYLTTTKKTSPLIVGLVVGLGLVILFAGGVMAYQLYLRTTSSPDWTDPASSVYDAALNSTEFVEPDTETGVPEAVWYQSQ